MRVTHSLLQLGHLYAQGHLEAPEEGAAMDCYRTAAEAGNLEAQASSHAIT
jgi:TPR repeat protein